MLQFELMATLFHAAPQTFSRLINSVVDDTLSGTGPLRNPLDRNLHYVPIDLNKSEKKVKIILRYDINKDLSCRYTVSGKKEATVFSA